MKISVIVPALNEAEGIGATLQDLALKLPQAEVIIVDGGSSDDTITAAAVFGRVIQSEKGRGVQMNAGAAIATGEVLIFLHADTQLPENVSEILQLFSDEVTNPIQAGCFRLRFNNDSAMLKFYAGWTRLHWHRLCFGDRVFVVRRSFFRDLGGFAPFPIFEDLDFVQRARKKTRWQYLSASVVTDTRRFDQTGILRQQALNFGLWFGYLVGIHPNKMAQYYTYSKNKHC